MSVTTAAALLTMAPAAPAAVPTAESAAAQATGTRAPAPAPAPASASASDTVRWAQRRLNELGCDSGPVDGILGDWTRSAIVRFQSRHGLTQTAALDKPTRQALRSKVAKRCDVRPVPAASGKGRRIVLSQRQNWIWLVAKNGTVKAQGGLIDNPAYLSRGRYATGSYCGRPARVMHNSDAGGTLWLDHYVRFAPCGIGFHRVPRYKTTGAQIHPDWLLGTNFRESHGCIRLSRPMSLAVWRFTVGRTRVRVV